LKRKPVGFLYLGECHTEYPAIEQSLMAQGINSRLIDLRDCDSVDWGELSLVNVRECRGYHRHTDFLTRIEQIASHLGQVPLTNSLSIIRATSDKSDYLQDLQLAGMDMIPTCWVKSGEEISLNEIAEHTGWQDFVVKPTVSSKSWKTFRVLSNQGSMQIAEADTRLVFKEIDQQTSLAELTGTHDLCIQQFMPEIFSTGELSFVFIDNQYSHAIRKTVATDNWLAHEFFGGSNQSYGANNKQISWAKHIFSYLQQRYGDFLYARIDAIPDQQNLRLLECELMVPRLFLTEGNALNKYVQAIQSWMS